MRDHYEVLDVRRKALDEEINLRFGALLESASKYQLKAIVEAYDVLSNSVKRAKYDKYGTEDPNHIDYVIKVAVARSREIDLAFKYAIIKSSIPQIDEKAQRLRKKAAEKAEEARQADINYARAEQKALKAQRAAEELQRKAEQLDARVQQMNEKSGTSLGRIVTTIGEKLGITSLYDNYLK